MDVFPNWVFSNLNQRPSHNPQPCSFRNLTRLKQDVILLHHILDAFQTSVRSEHQLHERVLIVIRSYHFGIAFAGPPENLLERSQALLLVR